MSFKDRSTSYRNPRSGAQAPYVQYHPLDELFPYFPQVSRCRRSPLTPADIGSLKRVMLDEYSPDPPSQPPASENLT